MPIQFKAIENPSAACLAQLAAFYPENPFYTASYANTMLDFGSQPVALFLEDDGELISGCTAFSKAGWLNRRLDIISLSKPADRDVFWKGLTKYCSQAKISVLEVNTFASPEVEIAELGGELSRKGRYEFVLDLDGTDIWRNLHRNSRRKITHAREAGLELRISNDLGPLGEHSRMTKLSMGRRVKRGENLSYDITVQDSLKFINNGSGTLYQAVRGKDVFSSVLLLQSSKGAYGQTSGSSPDGMSCGASHFLWYEIACRLQNESFTLLNFGGTETGKSGLRLFKESFGTRRVELDSAEFYLGGAVRKTIGSFARMLSTA